MATGKELGKSITPAVVLAVLTLFVFYTLRDYGPGSAVRRFHEDLMSQNLGDLQRVSLQSIHDPNVQKLASFLRTIEETGATAKSVSMERSPSEVDVLVLYHLNGGDGPFVWVVTNTDGIWRVDAAETVKANPGLQNG